MLGFIGRLDYQKGVDLITESFDWLMDQGVQLILLGSGREDLENSLRSIINLFPFRQLYANLLWQTVSMGHLGFQADLVDLPNLQVFKVLLLKEKPLAMPLL